MKKLWQRLTVLMQKRSFWINAIGGALIAVNELSGTVIPTKYAAELLIVLNLVNRFVKVINEEKAQ